MPKKLEEIRKKVQKNLKGKDKESEAYAIATKIYKKLTKQKGKPIK